MESRPKRLGRYNVYIACEGLASERRYFQGIRDEQQALWDISIDVYPQPNTPKIKSDPKNLVILAQKKLPAFAEAWAVFDKDGHDTAEAFEKAQEVVNGKNVSIGYSSVAFEHWVLLHFEKNKTSFTKSDCKDGNDKHFDCGKPDSNHPNDCKGAICAANRIREKYIPEYNKKQEYDLYEKIKHRNEAVLENALWLRCEMNATEAVANFRTVNPYTNLDILLRKLLNVENNISWGKLGNVYSTTEFDINVNYNKPEITVTILNKTASLLFVNLTNNDFLFISNDDGEKLELELLNAQIIDNNSAGATKTPNTISLYQNDKAEIKYKVSTEQIPLNLNFKYSGMRYMFML